MIFEPFSSRKQPVPKVPEADDVAGVERDAVARALEDLRERPGHVLHVAFETCTPFTSAGMPRSNEARSAGRRAVDELRPS